MGLVDSLVLGFVGLSCVFGLIRGILSQIMSIAGLVGAYLLAPTLGRAIAEPVQESLGTSFFVAEKVSILVIGLGIYLGARILGFGIEKLFFARIKEFRRLNRLGGLALGGVKAVLIVGIVFFFITLVPVGLMKSWSPRLMESATYRLAARYNPMGEQRVLERMRTLRAKLSDPETRALLEKDPKLGKLLEDYELKGALQDTRLLKSIQEGDYSKLQENEQIELFMKDDQLEALLDDLENP